MSVPTETFDRGARNLAAMLRRRDRGEVSRNVDAWERGALAHLGTLSNALQNMSEAEGDARWERYKSLERRVVFGDES